MKIGSMTITPLQIAIIILTLITAAVHFSLGGPMFLLNGLGYLGLLAAYFLPWSLFRQYHGLIRWAFMGYILITIILYFVFNRADSAWLDNTLGLFTKADELILLVLLFLDGRAAQPEQ